MTYTTAQIQEYLETWSRVIGKLEESVTLDDRSEIYRDAMIQRFEFTIEYTRKTLKKILSYKGEDDNLFPKDIFRVFQKLGLIDNLDVWFMFLNERNRLSHMYGEEIAQQSHTMIRAYISEFRDFYDRICTYLHRQDA